MLDIGCAVRPPRATARLRQGHCNSSRSSSGAVQRTQAKKTSLAHQDGLWDTGSAVSGRLCYMQGSSIMWQRWLQTRRPCETSAHCCRLVELLTVSTCLAAYCHRLCTVLCQKPAKCAGCSSSTILALLLLPFIAGHVDSSTGCARMDTEHAAPHVHAGCF